MAWWPPASTSAATPTTTRVLVALYHQRLCQYSLDVCGSYDPRAAVVPPYSVRLSTEEKKKKLLFGCVAYRMYNRGDPSSLEKSVKRNSCVTKWNEVVKNPS